jgi:uncharacterized SAM-binding protein YcdF (DUF218 family)
LKSLHSRTLLWTPVLLTIVSFAASDWWLPALGTALVNAEEPTPNCCDAIVVLAGDSHGRRVTKGGDLVRAGVAPIALVSGPNHMYSQAESDLAIAFAEKQGYERKLFLGLPNASTSTENEAQLLLADIRKRGYKKLLVVTSNYHTAGTGIEVHIAAAADKDVVPERWWQNREGRKKIFFEWIKTVTGPLGV